MKYKLGIIGTGIMANAIIDGILKMHVLEAKDILAFDIDEEKLNAISRKGVISASSMQEVANTSKAVLISVKPQNSAEIFSTMDFSELSLVISIMAGVTVSTLRRNINNTNCGIARIMPNMACKIGMGFCGICFDGASEEDKCFVKKVFESCGEILELQESKFDALTSISGSGPAYVYTFINSMIKGGVAGGLTFDEAKKMTIATMLGTATIVKDDQTDLDLLVDRVCSKGGTTIEAIKVFKNNNLENTIIDGILACKKRSEELSNIK